MKRANHTDFISIYSEAVLMALQELAENNSIQLRSLLLEVLDHSAKLDDEKIGWLKGETSLKVFCNSLTKHGFIICDFDLFKSHFEGIEQPQSKIAWNANLNELVYLFSRLREQGIIPLCKNPHLLLQNNFIDKYKKPIKAGSLRTLLDKGIRNKKRLEIIDNIINIVTSLNIKS